MRQTLRGRCWSVRHYFPKKQFQLFSANTEQTILELFAQYCGYYSLTVQHTSTRLYISQCLTLTSKLTTHQDQVHYVEHNPCADL